MYDNYTSHHEMEVEMARILKERNVRWCDDMATGVRRIRTDDIHKPLSDEEKAFIKKYFELMAYPHEIVFE